MRGALSIEAHNARALGPGPKGGLAQDVFFYLKKSNSKFKNILVKKIIIYEKSVFRTLTIMKNNDFGPVKKVALG